MVEGIHLQSTIFRNGIAVPFGSDVEYAVVVFSAPMVGEEAPSLGYGSIYTVASAADHVRTAIKWVPAKLLGERYGDPVIEIDGKPIVAHKSMVRHTLNIDTYVRIASEWNSLESDEERIKFLIDRNEIMIILDNDKTLAAFSCADEMNMDAWAEIQKINLNGLDTRLGWSEGVLALCLLAGIKAQIA